MKKRIWFDVLPVIIEDGRVVQQTMFLTDPDTNETIEYKPSIKSFLLDLWSIDKSAFAEMLQLLDHESEDYKIAKQIYDDNEE